MPEPKTRREEPGAQAILAAATAGTLIAGAEVPPETPSVGSADTGSGAASAIAAAVAALSDKREDTTWMADAIRPDFPNATEAQLRAAARLEVEREGEFLRRLRARLERDIPVALGKPDADAAVRKVLERERRYTEAHDVAAVDRVQGVVRREEVRRLSPEGAYWRMSPLVKEHTPICLAMAAVGWWPWEVLDLVYPPAHYGCRSELLTHDEARALGLMGEVPDTTGALERAHTILDSVGLLQEARLDGMDGTVHELFHSAQQYFPANGLVPGGLEEFADSSVHPGDPLLNIEESWLLHPEHRTPIDACGPAVAVGGLVATGRRDSEDVRIVPANGHKSGVSVSGFGPGSGAELQEAEHTGAMVALYPPPELAAELALKNGEEPAELHLTLAFLGDSRDLGDPEDTVAAVRAWAAECRPLCGEISGVGTFRSGPSPVTYLSVDLPELSAERERLVEYLDDAGTPASGDHGFTPHITLDYASRRPKVEKAIPVTFDRVTVAWGGEHFSIPLGRALTEAEHTELEEVTWNRRYAKGTVWGGRFMPRRGGFAPKLTLGDILRRLMGADAPKVVGRGGQPSPPVVTTDSAGIPDAGMPAVAPPDPPNTAGVRGVPNVPFAGDSPKRPRGFSDLARHMADMAKGLGEKHGREVGVERISIDRDASDTSGMWDGKGNVQIGPEAEANLAEADRLLSAQERVPDDVSSGVYMAYRTTAHEVLHSVNPMSLEAYEADPAARALEEALTEELAHGQAVELLTKAGHQDVLRWLARNPDAPRARGVYLPQRAGLAAILDEANVGLTDRRQLLEQLSLSVNPDSRKAILGGLLAKAQGISVEDATERVDALLTRVDQLDPLGDGAEILRHANYTDYRMRIRPNARIKVTGRGDGDYEGTVLNAAYGPDGRWYAEVEVKHRDENGQIVDTTIRYPDPDDVELLADAPRRKLKGKGVTGPVAEGDLVRMKQNNGDVLVGELRKVEDEDAFGWKAEVLTDSGEMVLVRESSVRDLKRARPGAQSIERKEPPTPKGVTPVSPSEQFLQDAEEVAKGNLPDSDADRVSHAINSIVNMRREEGALDLDTLASRVQDSLGEKPLADLPAGTREKRKNVVRAALKALGIAEPAPGPDEPLEVEGPDSFDPRRYAKPQRALIHKIRALPRGESLQAADGSQITRGMHGDSALIERPDGSRRRYATVNRLSNAEHNGISARVGIVRPGNGAMGSPGEREDTRVALGAILPSADLPDAGPTLTDEENDQLREAEGGMLSPAIARKITNAIGIDPFDVDLDELQAHAEEHRRKPRTRMREGSPCARKRDVDFAVHRLLPAMLQERYPEAARWLARTSPRWGESHYGDEGHLPLPEPRNAMASPGGPRYGMGEDALRQLADTLPDTETQPRAYGINGKIHARLLEQMDESDYGQLKAKLRAAGGKKMGKGTRHEVKLTAPEARELRNYMRTLLSAEESMGAGEGEPGLKQALKAGLRDLEDKIPDPPIQVSQGDVLLSTRRPRGTREDGTWGPLGEVTDRWRYDGPTEDGKHRVTNLETDAKQVWDAERVASLRREGMDSPGEEPGLIRQGDARVKLRKAFPGDTVQLAGTEVEKIDTQTYRYGDVEGDENTVIDAVGADVPFAPDRDPMMSPGERSELAERVLDGHHDTRAKHAVMVDGEWIYSEERRALHEQIIAKALEGKTAQPGPDGRPLALFTAGGGGSGKSSTLESGVLEEPPGAVTINPDLVKEQLPEFEELADARDEYAGGAVHEESSQVAKEIYRRAMHRNLNVVVDGVGGGPSFPDKLKRSIDKGYDTRIAVAYLPYEKALPRVQARADEEGRTVNDGVLRTAYRGVPRVFPLYEDMEGLQIDVFDTDVPKGDPAIHIATKAPDAAAITGVGETGAAKLDEFRQSGRLVPDDTPDRQAPDPDASGGRGGLSGRPGPEVPGRSAGGEAGGGTPGAGGAASPADVRTHIGRGRVVGRDDGPAVTVELADGRRVTVPEGMASPPLFGQGSLFGGKGKPKRTPELERSELEAPPEPVEGIPDYSGVELTDKKAAGGSNGARFATDPEGRKWLVKTYKGNRDRVATELLANAIYRELGVKVPNAGRTEVDVPEYGQTMALTYPLVDGSERRWTDANPDLAEGFVADALLANWDVVGLSQDNVLWNGDTPIRLDQGGTLEFRAMGQGKPFGPVPSELWTMNKPGGQAYGRMAITDGGLKAQAKDAELRLTPERIDALVDDAPFDDEEMRERVRQSLKDRVDWLGRFSRGEEGLPEPLGGSEATDEFEMRDAALELYPEEDAALAHYLDDEGQAEVDAHLRSGNKKEEASVEVQGTVAQLDALLGDKVTRVNEDFYAYLDVPSIESLGSEDAQKLAGKWLQERSYLNPSIEYPDTPGVIVRLTVPEGANALMPAVVDGIVDPTPGRVVLPRGSRIRLTQARDDDGKTVIDAIVQTR